MRRLSIALTGLMAAAGGLLTACASIAVTSQVNPALVHTVQCHTFAWAGQLRPGPLSATLANPVNEAQLRAAISTQLQAHGVRPEASGADCLVGYGIGVHNTWAGAYPYGWGFGWGWGWGPGWWGPGWDWPVVYPEGLIGVDLYDAHTSQPIWHADARVSLSDLRGQRAAAGIAAAVQAIFMHFPG